MDIRPDAPRTDAPTPAPEPLLRLLYRYLWPMWLFRDANRGSEIERAAAYRHNRTVGRHLAGYAGKWTVMAALALLSIQIIELSASAGTACHVACALLGVWFAWAVVVTTVFVAAWLYFRAVPG